MNKHILEHLKSTDPVLNNLIDQVGECTLSPRKNEPFDVLASSIISQQLSEKAATSIKNKLLEKIRKERPLLPEYFVDLNIEDMRLCGISNAKAKYILLIAEQCLNGSFDVSQFDNKDDKYIIDKLINIKGVGLWTAEMFLIFCLGKLDVFSVNDAGLKRAIKDLYGIKHIENEKKILKLTNNWKPYRSVASWYLWRHID